MQTQIFTNLQANDVITGDVREDQDIMRQVHSGLEKGKFRTLNLGPGGLVFKRGGQITAFIPHDELWKLEAGNAGPPAG